MTTSHENRCPTCGRRRPGRPKAEVPVPNILDALYAGKSVAVTAREFGTSRAAVYRVKAGAGVKS
jgi:DNA invertase Pin-like site-specific DNA recombinase